MSRMLAAAELAASQLQQHLLRGPAQLASGPQRGGVAGTLAPTGEALYVYGEITGYYLQWLASLNTNHTVRAAKAQAAQTWLQQYLAMSPWPPTRLYVTAHQADWRNQVLFAFDLAMIAGGLARCAHTQLLALTPEVIQNLRHWLQHFIGAKLLGSNPAENNSLHVIVNKGNIDNLPQRWSSVGGPFTAKTVSRLLLLAEHVSLPSALIQQCRTQLQHYAELADQFPPEMLHPTLYALEGVLLAEHPADLKTAQGLERLLALQAADGSLPEALDSPDVRRNDIVAQALRLAILLEHRLGDKLRFDRSIHLLAERLCGQVQADGTLGFAPGQTTANTWCAMFAEQALRLYVAREQQQPLPFTAADLV
jgi:hypothetical protein